MAYEKQPETLPWPTCRELMTLANEQLKPCVRVGGESYHTSGDSLVRPLFEALFPQSAHPWLFADLVTVFPQGTLHKHSDGFVDRIRRHIPIQTNRDAWTYHDGTWQHLELGGVYIMNPMRQHGAINWGDEPRVHLFFDVESSHDTKR